MHFFGKIQFLRPIKNRKGSIMDSELTSILKIIKQKTGIDVDAYAETMKFSATTRDEPDWVLPSERDFTEVFSDEKNGKTFFYFRFRNANLIGSISGAGETEKNYAYLIMSLLEGLSAEDSGLTHGEQIKSIILGDYTKQQIQKFIRKYSIPDVKCYMLIITSVDGKTERVLEYLPRYLSNEHDAVVLTEDMSCSLVKFIMTETEVQPEKLAHTIVENLSADGINVQIGVSEVVANLLNINNAYVQATTALRLAGVYSSKDAVHTYKDYILVKMLEDIPKFKLSEYLSVLEKDGAKAIFNDADMLSTAQTFLENDLNVSSTSRGLYMHRNTLIYRIDKIKRETGLDIQKFNDAVTFKLISILKKLLA